jgi:hypothetical protein
MTIAKLKAGYDAGIPSSLAISGTPTSTAYCFSDTQGSSVWSAKGPAVTPSSYKNNGTCS